MAKSYKVYKYYDKDDRLLYVGKSIAPIRRLQTHHSSSEWFDLIRTIKIENYDRDEVAIETEKKAIQTEHPLYNKEHSKNGYFLRKNTQKSYAIIKNVLDNIQEHGTSYEMDSLNDAVNFRQRIYNYRNAVVKSGQDQELIKRLKRVEISLVHKTVHITLGMPDYFEKVTNK